MKENVNSSLLEYNSDRNNKDLIKKVREILYDFSYSDLSIAYDNCDILRKSIFNFFYTGAFSIELESPTIKQFSEIFSNYIVGQLEDAAGRTEIDAVNAEMVLLPTWLEFYKNFSDNWSLINIKHNCYLNRLKANPVKYVVVYEAPPYKKDKELKEVYFLMSNQGSYATTIKKSFNDQANDVDCVMVHNNIGYFDLIMAQMPLSTDIREKWSKDSNWNIGGKQLPVVLLELGVAHMILKGVEFDRPVFALGPPAKTSASIFEHYSDKLFRVWKKKVEELRLEHIVFEDPNSDDFELVFSSDLSILNSNATHKKWGEQGKGEIFPLYKANVISGANFLSELLMKNAFDRL
jgi:hypothetical protein